jgi:predicted transcriptional regulator
MTNRNNVIIDKRDGLGLFAKRGDHRREICEAALRFYERKYYWPCIHEIMLECNLSSSQAKHSSQQMSKQGLIKLHSRRIDKMLPGTVSSVTLTELGIAVARGAKLPDVKKKASQS